MVEKVTTQLQGFDVLEKRLLALADLGNDKDGFDVMNGAIRKALKPVQARAMENAPFDPEGDDPAGHLRDNIKISVPRSHKKVGERGGRAAFGHVVVGNKGRTKEKAIAAEFGTEKQDAEPFLRPALYSLQGVVFQTLSVELEKGLDRRVKRIIKQEKKRQGG
ncbi:HK97 gp10 family phage protein [Vibrio mytili]|uniref:HK97-gp10 family putative phage morphogenesis protein n=1 Tax=Vibrio mytili TaxID=50718 RepID=UPI002F3FA4C7